MCQGRHVTQNFIIPVCLARNSDIVWGQALGLCSQSVPTGKPSANSLTHTMYQTCEWPYPLCKFLMVTQLIYWTNVLRPTCYGREGFAWKPVHQRCTCAVIKKKKMCWLQLPQFEYFLIQTGMSFLKSVKQCNSLRCWEVMQLLMSREKVTWLGLVSDAAASLARLGSSSGMGLMSFFSRKNRYEGGNFRGEIP